MQFGWLHLVVMATYLFISTASHNDAELKRISNSSSGTVSIKTHVIWRPSVDTDDEAESTPKLVILPLGAFLALIIAICAKISHWWNEDIREADGILQNNYSAKRPHHPVLVRTDTFEYSFDYFLPPPFCATQNGQYLSLPQTTIGQIVTVNSEGYSPTKPHPAAKGACTSDKTTPLLQYEMQTPSLPEIVLKPAQTETPSPSILKSTRPKRPLKRSRRRSRLSRTRPPGVSKLVMDSLHFNLYLLKLNMKSDGRLKTAYVHRRHSDGRAIRPKPRPKCVPSKPSSSSFSSYATSSTSLSTELGDLRRVSAPRSPSLSSDSGASSDIIWEMPNPEFPCGQGSSCSNFQSSKFLFEQEQFCPV